MQVTLIPAGVRHVGTHNRWVNTSLLITCNCGHKFEYESPTQLATICPGCWGIVNPIKLNNEGYAVSNRQEALMPGGIPKWIRVYDNKGQSIDRYFVVFTNLKGQGYPNLSMSAAPTHPQGVGQHGHSFAAPDRPTYSHLGTRITFDKLPEECQRVVISDYKDYWNL